jgi:putative NIF3 family GTP cyclohydrolase 1 type 2
MKLSKITDYLDSFLNINYIPDSSLNGLQVETDREIT